MTEKNKNNDRQPNYPLRRAMATTALVAGAFGVYKAGESLQNGLEYREVGTHSVALKPGEAPQTAVDRAVETIADDKGFDSSKVDGIVEAGQEVYGDFTPGVSDSVPQAGDEIAVTVTKNGFNDYKVEADPIDNQN